ncbi:MAG TPA: glycosyltransferase family 4 protein [Polyangia bacterium]
MLRIAFVVYGSLDNVSGGFIYDRALVGALRAAGHQVDVVALPWRRYAAAVAAAVVGAARGWRRRAAGAPYDAVVEDELVHPSLFLRGGDGRTPPARVRLALVHNLRSAQPGEPLAALKRRIERRYLRGVGGVVAVCARTLGDVRALAGGDVAGVVVHPGRDHVAPDVDAGAAAARAREPGPLRLLHVAAVRPAKGLARLLDALSLARARGADCVLDVVGSLEDAAHVRAMRGRIADAGLAGRITLHGERTGAALLQLYRRGQLFVLPSDREAYSLACLEALGFGLPVVATSRGGLGELVTPGRDGLLLDPDDTAAWAAALARLAGDRDALATMAAAAVARYRAHATWREAAAAVAAFIVERSRR